MIKKTINYLKEDSNRRTFVFTGFSSFLNLAYGIYNGFLGLLYNSIWHESVFVYYLLLMFIRGLLLFGERYIKKEDNKKRRMLLNFSSIILIIITIAMIAPAVMLVQNKREYNWGLIPAITSSTYTTYSITMAIINFKKAKMNSNSIIKQIRLINLITVLMSVLVLQNTMILANGGYDEKMKILSVYTSIGIIILIIAIEIVFFYKKIVSEKR